ncbi:MAG: asparagine synthase (glutamine-hydrolyzing) [Candidatus Woesearchaeota archaeon]|jgi:asparagine synthase (glutamine-hydrolysing)
MCGINGISWNDAVLVTRMNAAIRHRGPNDSGVCRHEKVTLGQVRLSILDLSEAGHQPMFYTKEKGASSADFQKTQTLKANLSITFNGEVYNYREIRDELITKGYTFTTKTDTEVILAAYAEWGAECVHQFNGMWAFCIYDKKANILFMSRDRFGVKPFHYYHRANKFMFSSEIKGILVNKELNLRTTDSVNKEAVELYFALGFIPAPHTIYKNVFKLAAGHNATYSLQTGQLTLKRYYVVPKYQPEFTYKKHVAETKKLMRSSIQLRMRSDVPVGAFLSGGIDSSTAVGYMKDFIDLEKLHTFSIGFEGDLDESDDIQTTRRHFKTNHHHYFYTKSDFIHQLKTFPFVYDEPFYDYSGFPTLKVNQIAKKHVTVVLGGDGGDEMFAGYNAHLKGRQMDMLYKVPRVIRKLIARLPVKKNLSSYASLYLLKEACRISLYPKSQFYARALEHDGIKPESYKKWATVRLTECLKLSDNKLAEALRLFDLQYNTLSDNFLTKVDRASMYYAIEVRSPFLDYRFAQLAARIPASYKMTWKQTKSFLRQTMAPLLPKEIVNKKKQGFTPPIAKWIMDKDFDKKLSEANEQLRLIHPQLAKQYDTLYLKESHKLYANYRVRLYLFKVWWDRWIL